MCIVLYTAKGYLLHAPKKFNYNIEKVILSYIIIDLVCWVQITKTWVCIRTKRTLENFPEQLACSRMTLFKNDIEEQMEAWSDTESILEFTQGHCFSHGTMHLSSAARRFLCSIRTLMTHSYCAHWTILIECYGLILISMEWPRLRNF